MTRRRQKLIINRHDAAGSLWAQPGRNKYKIIFTRTMFVKMPCAQITQKEMQI